MMVVELTFPNQPFSLQKNRCSAVELTGKTCKVEPNHHTPPQPPKNTPENTTKHCGAEGAGWHLVEPC